MSGVNFATLVGYVGADPEIRKGRDGRIASFSLATSESWRDKATGERRERTEWHRVVVFNDQLAGVCADYVRKGSHLYVSGAIRTRKWTDQKGVERYTTEVVLSGFNHQLQMLDRKERAPAADSADDYGQTSTRAAAGPPAGSAPPSDLDDEIPF